MFFYFTAVAAESRVGSQGADGGGQAVKAGRETIGNLEMLKEG